MCATLRNQRSGVNLVLPPGVAPKCAKLAPVFAEIGSAHTCTHMALPSGPPSCAGRGSARPQAIVLGAAVCGVGEAPVAAMLQGVCQSPDARGAVPSASASGVSAETQVHEQGHPLHRVVQNQAMVIDI